MQAEAWCLRIWGRLRLALRGTRQQPLSWSQWLWAIFAALGAAYAASLCIAEYFFAKSFGIGDLEKGYYYADQAARFYPFDRRYRQGPARILVAHSNAMGNPPGLAGAAIREIDKIIKIDHSAADLLAYEIALKLTFGTPEMDNSAKETYQQFKRVARASPLSREYGIKPSDLSADPRRGAGPLGDRP